MSLTEEITNTNQTLQIKLLRLFLDLYPVVEWNVWKQQVIEEREVLNPFKRFGLIWFHIPSVIKCLHTLDYANYSWLNQHNPFFKNSMAKKVFCVKANYTRMVRGMSAQSLEI